MRQEAALLEADESYELEIEIDHRRDSLPRRRRGNMHLDKSQSNKIESRDHHVPGYQPLRPLNSRMQLSPTESRILRPIWPPPTTRYEGVVGMRNEIGRYMGALSKGWEHSSRRVDFREYS